MPNKGFVRYAQPGIIHTLLVEIRKRKRIIGRLVPLRPKASGYPDFAARARKIFGDKVLPITGAELVSWGRGE